MAINNVIDIVRETSELMLDDTFHITQKGGYANIVTSSDTAVQAFLKRRPRSSAISPQRYCFIFPFPRRWPGFDAIANVRSSKKSREFR